MILSIRVDHGEPVPALPDDIDPNLIVELVDAGIAQTGSGLHSQEPVPVRIETRDDAGSGWGKDVEPDWTEQLELRVGDGTLTITYLPEG
jgi:hypothetical protein